MEPVLTRGCACSAIRYKTSASPEFSMICQCRQCQRITDAGHAVQFVVPVESVTVKGNVKYFELTADDGNIVSSGFCENCGSPILKKSSGFPQYLMFHPATLDNPGSYEPQMVVYSQFKQPWNQVDPTLPRK